MDMVAEAYEAGKAVFDFSADYRLKNVAEYEAYYEVEHTHPDLLDTAVYGLPELHRDEIAASHLIAVPGCYPTSVILGLAPAVDAGIIKPDMIIADSKSGVSGAGRKTSLTTHFSEVTESFMAYKVASHRHTPEMDQELGGVGEGAEFKVTFVPHLVPQVRGILSTCYAYLNEDTSLEQVHEVYSEFYADEPFVVVHPLGKLPATKFVTGTNRCDVGVAIDPRTNRLVAVSVVDNLIKGLSGAAVQCINLVYGWDETTGLPTIPCWP
jgi:N-acetyl-gamma-glutamyl-phosphate reductase